MNDDAVTCFMVERIDADGPRVRRVDTGEIFESLAACPPGAMWDAPWMHDHGQSKGGFLLSGPNVDGLFLIVKLPNGHDWMIDGRASNCTLPKDDDHRCWCRHGTPPVLTVDKIGKTCSAGAGSIKAGDYHGFLRNGRLVKS